MANPATPSRRNSPWWALLQQSLSVFVPLVLEAAFNRGSNSDSTIVHVQSEPGIGNVKFSSASAPSLHEAMEKMREDHVGT